MVCVLKHDMWWPCPQTFEGSWVLLTACSWPWGPGIYSPPFSPKGNAHTASDLMRMEVGLCPQPGSGFLVETAEVRSHCGINTPALFRDMLKVWPTLPRALPAFPDHLAGPLCQPFHRCPMFWSLRILSKPPKWAGL